MDTESRVIQCPACGARNRVPLQKIHPGLEPVCGRCKKPLPVTSQAADGRPLVVTDATFADQVERSPLPVLLDLWAQWCPPCRLIAPIIDELAMEFAGRARVAKLNVDENPKTQRRFGVQSIPTLLVLKNGREVDRIVGALPKPEIARRLSQHLDGA